MARLGSQGARLTRSVRDNVAPAGVYRNPPMQAPSWFRRVAAEQFETGPLGPTGEDIEKLKRAWLRMPTWDIEYASGFETVMEHLALWHDEQIHARARAMGCSPLAASVVEELCRAWLTGRPPQGPLAGRVLLMFR